MHIQQLKKYLIKITFTLSGPRRHEWHLADSTKIRKLFNTGTMDTNNKKIIGMMALITHLDCSAVFAV